MRLLLFILLLTWSLIAASAQAMEHRLRTLHQQLEEVREHEQTLLTEIEKLDLLQHRNRLRPLLPKLSPEEELIEHQLLFLVYSEAHEQAKWVGHVLSPRVVEGTVARTNDFRRDPLVPGGTARETDYFLKTPLPDGRFEYDGFGYDRGHLAPSADFRWSPIALSESYFYSNISPQNPDFNRGIWAELESTLRAYLIQNPESELMVFTGPLLSTDLPYIERSINQVSIPRYFWKLALDLRTERMIGFLLPNTGSERPLRNYAVPVDSIEFLTGIDFFPALKDDQEEKLEAQSDPESWLDPEQIAQVEPLWPPSLPKNHFNTTQARRYMGRSEEVYICGTVVDGRRSRNQNVLMNLDRPYPDQVFTIFIREEHLVNFSGDPLRIWENEKVCVFGKVASLSGTPAIYVEREEQLFPFPRK